MKEGDTSLAECVRDLMQQEINRLKTKLAESEARVAGIEKAEAHYWWKIGMANARRLIKANKSTSNQSLMAELFGMGFGSAGQRCRQIGLEPSSNKTSLSDIYPFDQEVTRQQQTNGE
jgi:hypothetical protein